MKYAPMHEAYAHNRGGQIMMSLWSISPGDDAAFSITPATALQIAEMLVRAAREAMAERDAAAT